MPWSAKSASSANSPLPVKRIQLVDDGSAPRRCSAEAEPVVFYTTPKDLLLSAWPAQKRWRLEDDSLRLNYGQREFLALHAEPHSEFTANTSVRLSDHLDTMDQDPYTYISEIRFRSPFSHIQEEKDSCHDDLLADVAPALPLLSLPRDGGAYAHAHRAGADSLHHDQERDLFRPPPPERSFLRWFRCRRPKGRWSPLFRWMLCGGRDSGIGLHKDPHSSMFWNACLSGSKKWCLFPPSTPRDLLLSTTCNDGGFLFPSQIPARDPACADLCGGYMPEASAKAWFEKEYPRVRAAHCKMQQAGCPAGIGMVEFIQNAGEVVVCPGDWWHVVLVLEPSVTYTENWVTAYDLGAALGILERDGQFFEANLWRQALPVALRIRAFGGWLWWGLTSLVTIWRHSRRRD